MTFDGPARATPCALQIVQLAPDLGLEVRAGIQTGECEVMEGIVRGRECVDRSTSRAAHDEPKARSLHRGGLCRAAMFHIDRAGNPTRLRGCQNGRSFEHHTRRRFRGRLHGQELARMLPPSEEPTITLVDQNNYLLFTPMLTEVAGGELDSEDVAVPIRRLYPG